MSTIHFTPLGGAGEVGANSYILEIDGLTLVLDAGLHPKKEGMDALPAYDRIEKTPSAVLVSHSHIDHCGSLPYLMRLHPGTSAYMTPPTVSIMDRMLHNSVSVMGILRNERGIEEYPLYEHHEAETAVRRSYGIPMYQPFSVNSESDVRIEFTPAGHVLGSASIRITSPGHNVYYTGDICTIEQELMGAYEFPRDPESIDTLIVESTYGANGEADSKNYEDEITRLGAEVKKVLDRDGVVLIPSFALGRTQEMLNILARLRDRGIIPNVPMYASGLGRALYEIYNRYSDFLKPNTLLYPLREFGRVGDVWDPEVVKKLIKEPCIIAATSGMMLENTPSAMIAQTLIQEERHGIFFVGYCDPDTLGYKVKTSSPGDRLRFALGEKPVEVKLANIQSLHFSAHAPRSALQRVIDYIKPKNIIYVHGDPPAVEWMAANTAPWATKYQPAIGETVAISR